MTGVLVRGGDSDTGGYRERTMCRRKEKAAIYKLRREAAEETDPAHALISDSSLQNCDTIIIIKYYYRVVYIII